MLASWQESQGRPLEKLMAALNLGLRVQNTLAIAWLRH